MKNSNSDQAVENIKHNSNHAIHIVELNKQLSNPNEPQPLSFSATLQPNKDPTTFQIHNDNQT